MGRQRRGDLLLREGQVEAAAALKKKARGVLFKDVPALLLKSGSRSEQDRLAGDVEKAFASSRDPESKWFGATILAVGGYREAALRLLGAAVEGNYLCHPAMDNDPLFDSIRKDPQFAAIRDEAIRKQKAFLERRAGLR